MARWKILPKIALAGLAFTAISWSSHALSETVLTFNRWTPATHHFHARIFQPWAERVAEATEGRVKIRFTPASLGAPTRQYDLARTGVADITANNQAYTEELFPLALFAEMPFLSNSAEALSVANWRATQRLQEQTDEYKDVKLLAVFSNGPAMIFTRQTEINSIDDIKGLRMRTTDGIPSQIARKLGATPITAPITEGYQMLSKGIIDSMILPADSIYSFRMDQYLEHMTRIPNGLYSSSFFVVMNKAKWDALPEQDQKAIMRVSGEHLAIEAGKVWDDQDKMATAAFKERGMNVSDASPALLADIESRLASIQEDWIKLAQSKGIDGKALLEEVSKEVRAYEVQKAARGE